jgi:hypothetical protein
MYDNLGLCQSVRVDWLCWCHKCLCTDATARLLLWVLGASCDLSVASFWTVSFAMSIHPSVRLHGTVWLPLDRFSLDWIFGDFSKICWENPCFIKLDRNNWYFTWRPLHIFIVSHSVLRMRNVSDKSCIENLNTFYIQWLFPSFSLFENCAVYKSMWKNIVLDCLATNDSNIQCMLCACWVPKTTNTLRIYNTYCFSTVTVMAHMCVSATVYVHGLSYYWCRLHCI